MQVMFFSAPLFAQAHISNIIWLFIFFQLFNLLGYILKYAHHKFVTESKGSKTIINLKLVACMSMMVGQTA